MSPDQLKQLSLLERFSVRATRWVGSIQSLIVHTFLFIIAFILVGFGVPLEEILLVLTTIVSLEAIYLSIFIQMSVNRQSRRLHAVSKDIDEIQEDIDEIQEDVGEIQKDVDEIQEDVEEIQEEVEDIGDDVEDIHGDDQIDGDRYTRIEKNLEALVQEIANLKSISEKKK